MKRQLELAAAIWRPDLKGTTCLTSPLLLLQPSAQAQPWLSLWQTSFFFSLAFWPIYLPTCKFLSTQSNYQPNKVKWTWKLVTVRARLPWSWLPQVIVTLLSPIFSIQHTTTCIWLSDLFTMLSRELRSNKDHDWQQPTCVPVVYASRSSKINNLNSALLPLTPH